MSVSTVSDGGQTELELSDDPYDGKRLRMEAAPVLVTLTRIGKEWAQTPVVFLYFVQPHDHLREQATTASWILLPRRRPAHPPAWSSEWFRTGGYRPLGRVELC